MNRLSILYQNDTMYYHQNVNGSAYVLWKRFVKNRAGLKRSKHMIYVKRRVEYYISPLVAFKIPNTYPLLVAVCKNRNLQLMMELVRQFPDLNLIVGVDLIEKASSLGDMIMVRWLYSKDCDPTAHQNCSIRHACTNGHFRVAKWLYNRGCDPSAFDDSAITWASNYGHLKMVKWLYSIGCNPRVNNDLAIVWASSNGHLDVVKWLYSKGCNPTAYQHWAIVVASNGGYLELVKWLYGKGCDPTACTNFSMSSVNHPSVVDFLVSIGCSDPRIS